MRKIQLAVFLLLFVVISHSGISQKIDRKSVVARHRITIKNIDTLGSLTVGNGKFAFTVDATGLQSFPEQYAAGIPLGTQSEWGWHSLPNKEAYKFSEALVGYSFNGGKDRLYAVQAKEKGRAQQAVDYYRQNPHRLQLGNIGFEITKKDGNAIQPEDVKSIDQQLNLWTGEITSHFTIEGESVKVITCSDFNRDIIAVQVTSGLIQQKRLKIRFRFPYPTMEFADKGTNYNQGAAHQTMLTRPSPSSALFSRKMDKDHYYVLANWNNKASIKKAGEHYFTLIPEGNTSFETTIAFSPSNPAAKITSFAEVRNSSLQGWEKFWLSGAAVDFAGSTDSRAAELERRMVLSQYLTRVQCAGNFPPQETGLTYNSWYGKPHMEMYWWHGAHFALWNRTDLLEKSMQWYFKAYKGAEEIAKRQGYKGVRWQKMTDHEGGEAPSSVGSFLIWQQPHVIYLAELIHRNNPSKDVLQKYRQLIFATADFMASFAFYNKAKDRFDLGEGIIPAQECFDPLVTFNSPYELAYWKWALQVAQEWRIRLGLPADKNWQLVIDKIAPLAMKDGVYAAAESVEDSYSPESKFTIDHPAVLAALSTLPPNGMVDTAIMLKTFNTVEKAWHWDHTWGWDFPLVAMTATRLHQPEAAVNALFKDVKTNTYLVNGHNYQTPRLTLYLPGNGGLLSAIALMCAGFEGNTVPNPGFPKDGKWQVKWEGLKKSP